MFYYVKGTLVHTFPGLAVIDCGGVAFRVLTSDTSLRALPQVGEEALLYTYLSVREDAMELFGFSTNDELECFRMLLSVTGVGPRMALSVLSVCTPERFAVAVVTSDEKALTKASGVGKKLASRIILELKDKIAKEQLPSGKISSIDLPREADALEEALSALMVLGYTRGEATRALSGLADGQTPVEELVKAGLKALMKG